MNPFPETPRAHPWHLRLILLILALTGLAIVLAHLGGCAQLGPLGAIAWKDGPALVQCGANEKTMVDAALADGKVSVGAEIVDWLSFVATNLQCVAPAVKDIFDLARSAGTMVAGPAMPAKFVPLATVRRAHTALVVCRAAGVCK